MFSSKANIHAKSKKHTTSRDANAVTILTSGCHFSGKLFCRGSSRIAGRIDGQIISEGFLVIEEDAVINAEIKAEEAVIQGKVHGKLNATIKVEICPTGHMDGDIITPSLVIREGAQFNGHATMSRNVDVQNQVKAPQTLPSVTNRDTLKKSLGKNSPLPSEIGIVGGMEQAVPLVKGPDIRINSVS